MKKYNILFLFFIITNFSIAQVSSSTKEFFRKNILELDPIEGIYDATFFVQEYVEDYQWPASKVYSEVAIRRNKDNVFYIEGSDGLTFTKIGETNVYNVTHEFDVKPARGRGFYENGIFKYRFNVPIENNRRGDNHYYDGGGELIKTFPTASMYRAAYENQTKQNLISSGTGFFLSNNGYIITNYHVIENAKSIKVSGINDDNKSSYVARVEIADKQNDLAILKITDSSFKPITKIPYMFKFSTSNVGEDCFVLGYPLISSMGMDIKLTNGIISSKTGYDGNIAQYQISAPVQPGNSGGPLFDKQGNVIGIVQAKHKQAENAGYAIKASYIRNLVELLPIPITFPQTNQLANKTLPQQVQLASKAVCVIIVNGD